MCRSLSTTPSSHTGSIAFTKLQGCVQKTCLIPELRSLNISCGCVRQQHSSLLPPFPFPSVERPNQQGRDSVHCAQDSCASRSPSHGLPCAPGRSCGPSSLRFHTWGVERYRSSTLQGVARTFTVGRDAGGTDQQRLDFFTGGHMHMPKEGAGPWPLSSSMENGRIPAHPVPGE